MRIDLLEAFGLDTNLIALLKGKYGERLLPIQERAFKEHHVLNGGNFLISAVTSSGKTLVGEILALFYGSRGKRVFYLVPTKALAEEKFEQTILFLPDKPTTESLAHHLVNTLNLPPAEGAIAEMQTLEESVSRDMLIAFLQGGVAVHNADLSWEERDIIERHTRSGNVRVLCTTTTLAVGLNLPMKNAKGRLTPTPLGKNTAAKGRKDLMKKKNQIAAPPAIAIQNGSFPRPLAEILQSNGALAALRARLVEARNLRELVTDPPVIFMDEEQQVFFYQGIPIKLQPACFTYLLILAERPKQVVGRDEIYRRLWPGPIKYDGSNKHYERQISDHKRRCIAQIRKGIAGKIAVTPGELEALIFTKPKVGYMLNVEKEGVVILPSPLTDQNHSLASIRHRQCMQT